MKNWLKNWAYRLKKDRPRWQPWPFRPLEMQILACGFLGVSDQTMGIPERAAGTSGGFLREARQEAYTDKVCRFMARKHVRETMRSTVAVP